LQELTRMGLLSNPSPEIYKTWARNLSDIDPRLLANGLKNAKDFKGYFSLPAFRELCKDLDISKHGLPAPQKAYEEACMAPSPKDRHKWSHPAVYHAGRLTGWHELHSMTAKEMMPRFSYNYEVLCKRVMAGENINLDVPQAIPQSIPRPLTKEENIARMEAMRKELGL
jgi:hypothetical protein